MKLWVLRKPIQENEFKQIQDLPKHNNYFKHCRKVF